MLSNFNPSDNFNVVEAKLDAIVDLLNSYGLALGDTDSVNKLLIPVGGILPYIVSTPPNDSYFVCDGQAISRTAYPVLFGMIGGTYGVGDGSTTFNLPNFKGQVLAGYDPGDPDYQINNTGGGSKTHTIAYNNMPPHGHIYDKVVATGGAGLWVGGNSGAGSTYTISNSGGTSVEGIGTPLDTRDPYKTINYIIRAK